MGFGERVGMPDESRESGQRIETDRVASIASSRIGGRCGVSENDSRRGCVAAVDGDEGNQRGDRRNCHVARGERQVAGFNRQVVAVLVCG